MQPGKTTYLHSAFTRPLPGFYPAFKTPALLIKNEPCRLIKYRSPILPATPAFNPARAPPL
jgi:hypothetical protein